MGNIVKFFVAISALILSSAVMGQQVLDRVAVIVNEGVVLESEVDQLLKQVKANAARSNAELPADKVLRIQAMDRLILTELQKQVAITKQTLLE